MTRPPQSSIPAPDMNSARAKASEPPMFGQAQPQGTRPQRKRQPTVLGNPEPGFGAMGGKTLLGM